MTSTLQRNFFVAIGYRGGFARFAGLWARPSEGVSRVISG